MPFTGVLSAPGSACFTQLRTICQGWHSRLSLPVSVINQDNLPRLAYRSVLRKHTLSKNSLFSNMSKILSSSQRPTSTLVFFGVKKHSFQFLVSYRVICGESSRDVILRLIINHYLSGIKCTLLTLSRQ